MDTDQLIEDTAPLTREEIRDLPRAAQVALAARCAMRVMPALSLPKGRLSWKDGDAARHVDAIEAAALAAALFGMVPAVAAGDAAGAAQAAGDAARAAGGAAEAAYAAYAAAEAAYAARAAYASDAADAAAYAARAAAAIVADYAARAAAAAAAGDAAYAAARNDFGWLMAHGKGENPEIDAGFFLRPLWLGIPAVWEVVLSNWRDALVSIGLSAVATRHDAMLKGAPDLDEWKHVVETWHQRVAPSEIPAERSTERVKRKMRQKTRTSAVPELEAPQPDTGAVSAHLSGSNLRSEIPPSAPASEDELRAREAGPGSAVNERPDTNAASAPPMADEPSAKDRLGRTTLVEALADLFWHLGDSKGHTIALFGDWGSGKSSVFVQLRKTLRAWHTNAVKNGSPGPPRFHFAEFNAWRYENTKSIPAGIAQEVVRTLVEGSSEEDGTNKDEPKPYEALITQRLNKALQLPPSLLLAVVGIAAAFLGLCGLWPGLACGVALSAAYFWLLAVSDSSRVKPALKVCGLVAVAAGTFRFVWGWLARDAVLFALLTLVFVPGICWLLRRLRLPGGHAWKDYLGRTWLSVEFAFAMHWRRFIGRLQYALIIVAPIALVGLCGWMLGWFASDPFKKAALGVGAVLAADYCSLSQRLFPG